jgi:hypothetical protein
VEKRGNSEVEITMEGGKLIMTLPGTDQKILYDGRYDHLQNGLIKKAAIHEGASIILEV